MPYIVGQEITLSCMFRNASGDPTNPTTVQLQLGRPDGAAVVLGPGTPISNPSVGVYNYTFIPGPGDWIVRWIGRGGVTAPAEDGFTVLPSKFRAPL